MKFSLNDLLIAYKKAKSEVYHEKLQVSILAFPDYESNLVQNLTSLLKKLNSGNIDFVKKKDFGLERCYYPIVKKIVFTPEDKSEHEAVYYSDLKSRWKHKKYNLERVDFRIISNLSVEFHIISSLWIDKVAYGFERKLSKSSYGSRLNEILEKSPSTSGHFKTYIHNYRKWQKDGLDKIRVSLESSDETIALTADIKSFYHHIDPSFLLEEAFFEQFTPIEALSDEQLYLNKLLMTAISHWSRLTFGNLSKSTSNPYLNQQHVGIPIGLAASKVIANLVLKEFDDAIEQELMPLYYGRYVDDIFIVLGHNPTINNRSTLWEFISKKITSLVRDTHDITSFKFELIHANKSTIIFNKEKERIFFLDKACGISILNEIERELNENSSEWRLLPDVDQDLDQFSEEVLQATSDSTETANSLRKSDGISIQRLKYALFIRSAEELMLSHPYYFWKDGVKELFRVTSNFVTDPDVLPNYLQYMVKILRLTAYSLDFKSLKMLWNSFTQSVDLISRSLEGQEEEIILYREYLNKSLELAVYSGLSLIRPENAVESFIKSFEKLSGWPVNLERVKCFFICDLHLVPLHCIFNKHAIDLKAYFKLAMDVKYIENYVIDFRKNIELEKVPFFQQKIIEANKIFSEFIFHPLEDGKLPISIFSLTRKMSYHDITSLLDRWLFEQKRIYRSFLSVFDLGAFDVKTITEGAYICINANNLPYKENPIVAITSYEVQDSSWRAHLLGMAEPDGTRLKRLYELIKGILKTKDKRIDYIVLPELALPEYAINMISRQIKGSGITLITGIEYIIDRSAGTVRNQLVMVIPITIAGRTHHVQLVQEKLIPAIHEASELYNTAKLKLVPINNNKYIISKNGFTFSSLICNDFLNIDNRQVLRGKIDALFLVEWNKDIETYNSLVESTANDLHSYVIQVNNRLYGDTRIRAPFKEPHQRDVSRIRGGLIDYFVISSLQVHELRTFQMNHVSPSKPFKPIPTGFVMDDRRKLR